MAQILLIDDDEMLRDTLRQMLELDGHAVTEAADGEQGLALFRSRAGRFDAVITDILMPGIDGTRVIVELHRSHPQLPVIAISGGRRVLSPQFNLETAALAGASCQLSKPFSRHDLQSALTQALAASHR
ncbi:response regulator [Rubrivivax gelatinosus]|uniref:response regulator n=1 Tax=Rubrivivax gelatinosus TaxID=28068 RepID=UPI0002F987EF|nr:response regulator [Rubrivivax gelatinosus]MBG6082871.1 CheY-like chemotaxis protein [Rubrivivax gelatinosus]